MKKLIFATCVLGIATARAEVPTCNSFAHNSYCTDVTCDEGWGRDQCNGRAYIFGVDEGEEEILEVFTASGVKQCWTEAGDTTWKCQEEH